MAGRTHLAPGTHPSVRTTKPYAGNVDYFLEAREEEPDLERTDRGDLVAPYSTQEVVVTDWQSTRLWWALLPAINRLMRAWLRSRWGLTP